MNETELRAVLMVRFPLLAEVTSGFESSIRLDLDNSYRSVLKATLRTIRPEVAEGALDSMVTWGDVFAWVATPDSGITSNGVEPLFDRALLQSPSVRLRTLERRDYDALYHSAIDPVRGSRWRFRGRTPSPEAFESMLFDGVLAQFAVASRSSDRCIGLVAAYNPDLGSGHVAFAFYKVFGNESPGGAMTEAAVLFLQHCFDSWPLRKVFIELPSFNRGLVTTMEDMGLATFEGSQLDYFYSNGAFHDLLHLSISRETWLNRMAPWFR